VLLLLRGPYPPPLLLLFARVAPPFETWVWDEDEVRDDEDDEEENVDDDVDDDVVGDDDEAVCDCVESVADEEDVLALFGVVEGTFAGSGWVVCVW